MEGFQEIAPNVWVPPGYRPTEYELPTPIVRTPGDAAAEYAKCVDPEGGCAYFVLHFGWTLHVDDPSGIPQYRKVPAYPCVLDFLDHVQHVGNYHIEKSRQMMMSWLWMAVFLWDILFHETWANVAFSIQESLVDDGGPSSTPDSLFGKVRILWQGLPAYLQHPVTFRRLLIQCPTTRSYIRGRAPTKGAGRGPAYNRGLVDEAAHVQHGEVLFRALRASVKKGLILNSSPLGKGNTFARIRFDPSGTFQRLSYKWTMLPTMAEGLNCTCGWVSDPQSYEMPDEQFTAHTCLPHEEKIERRAKSPKYDIATADYTPAQRASEYDLSYEESARGRVFSTFDAIKHTLDHQLLVGPRRDEEEADAYRRRYLKRVLDPTLVTVVGWDFGVSDLNPTSLCLGQEIEPGTMKIRWIDEEEHTGQSWKYYRLFVNGLWAPVVQEVTGRAILHYGDPAGRGRDSSLTSWASNLGDATPNAIAEAGPPIILVTGPQVGGLLEWYDWVNDRIRRGDFEVSTMCALMIDMLGQWGFPLDEEGNPIPGDHLPVHNEWSHIGTAMTYVYRFRYHNRLRRVVQEKKPMTTREVLQAGRGDPFKGMKKF